MSSQQIDEITCACGVRELVSSPPEVPARLAGAAEELRLRQLFAARPQARRVGERGKSDTKKKPGQPYKTTTGAHLHWVRQGFNSLFLHRQ